MIDELRKVIKRLHYPLKVMLVCVRWYAAYPLSLRHIEEMMIERGVFGDDSTVHRWALKILPVLSLVFRRRRRPVGGSWRMDETYVKVGGQWKYLYRAVDRDGHTVDFLLTAHHNAAARWSLERAIKRVVRRMLEFKSFACARILHGNGGFARWLAVTDRRNQANPFPAYSGQLHCRNKHLVRAQSLLVFAVLASRLDRITGASLGARKDCPSSVRQYAL